MEHNECNECLYRVVKEVGWCYMFAQKPTDCKFWISWKAIRNFFGKMLTAAMAL